MDYIHNDASEKKITPNVPSHLRGTAIVSTVTLLSRILGFVRDLLTAHLFGAGLLADTFFVAFRIPNLLRSFVAEGALTSAFVPVFTDEVSKGGEKARHALRSVSAFLLVVTSVLTVIGIVYAEEIAYAFAPGFGRSTDQARLCTRLLQIMLPFIMCISMVSMLNGALNSIGIFGAAAWSQVWMNLTLIAGAGAAFMVEPLAGVYLLALSVLLGGIVQVVVQIPTLRRAGFSLLPSLSIFTDVTQHIVRLMLPALVGATVYQFQIFLNTVLASLLESGSVSWLYYADRLIQLPIGIFTIALASVLLPALSQARSFENTSLFAEKLVNALRFTSFVIMPIAALLYVGALPLARVMYERGAFTSYASTRTAEAIQAYSLGLWAVSCHSMVARAFIARKDTATPTLVGLLTLLVTTILSLFFMGPPVQGEGMLFNVISGVQGLLVPPGFQAHWGHAGLALASSISAFLSFGTLALLLQKRIPKRTPIIWRPFGAASLRAVGASLALIVAGKVPGSFFELSKVPLVELVGACVCGGVAYLVVSAILKSKELQETFAAISRIRSNRRMNDSVDLR